MSYIFAILSLSVIALGFKLSILVLPAECSTSKLLPLVMNVIDFCHFLSPVASIGIQTLDLNITSQVFCLFATATGYECHAFFTTFSLLVLVFYLCASTTG
jgi:hypothetical protein